MKLWIDPKNPPSGEYSQYKWCKSFDDVVSLASGLDAAITRAVEHGNQCFLERDYVGRSQCYAHANACDIELIDVVEGFEDHAKLLSWIKETGRVYIKVNTHLAVPICRHEKCYTCEFKCRCCASHFQDNKWPGCSRCEKGDEFQPASHVKLCPLDGQETSTLIWR